MKKHLKILLIISLFINLVFVISIFIPKYYYIGSDFVGLDFKQIKSGGFVKGLNFEDIGGEFYIIFNGKSEYTDKGEENIDYYFINGLAYEGGAVYSGLNKLDIKSRTSDKIELSNDMYTFEVYKSGKVLGKDKNGEIFELVNMKKN